MKQPKLTNFYSFLLPSTDRPPYSRLDHNDRIEIGTMECAEHFGCCNAQNALNSRIRDDSNRRPVIPKVNWVQLSIKNFFAIPQKGPKAKKGFYLLRDYLLFVISQLYYC